MIESNELRIGNLFWESYGGYKIVTAIGQNKVGYAKDTVAGAALGMNISGQFDCEHINPIPITPEILEKCGFIKTVSMLGAEKDFEYTDYRYGMMVLNTNEKWGHTEVEYDPFNIDDRGHICKVKYLHQLQNLYYSLTGQELNIQL